MTLALGIGVASVLVVIKIITQISIFWFLIPLYMGFATPHIGEVGAFKLLSIVCMISGIFVTAMWSRYEKSKQVAKC
jgi:hypothetical protein